MKQTNKKSKKLLLIIPAAIILIIVIHLCVNAIYAAKIPHHYASAEEGRALLLANTEYYNNFTQNDIDFRVKKSGATLDELLELSTNGIKNFNIFEKAYLDGRIAKMQNRMQMKGYELPPLDEIVYVKTDMDIEGGASGYTHGTEIYLNSTLVTVYTICGFIPGFNQSMDKLLWHELFHCLTRCNPDFRSDMYSLIHFTVADSDFEQPPCVLDYTISNPDVEHHDSYATFMIDGQEIDCSVAWITTQNYAEAQTDFFSSSITALIPIDGTDIYYTTEQASNFDEVFGTNTNYVIDPEECMADNFSYAMMYGIKGPSGNGYPNPEIIQGVIDHMKK